MHQLPYNTKGCKTGFAAVVLSFVEWDTGCISCPTTQRNAKVALQLRPYPLSNVTLNASLVCNTKGCKRRAAAVLDEPATAAAMEGAHEQLNRHIDE
eukprot:1139059-Pelagomonas_calceolata.AAC.4